MRAGSESYVGCGELAVDGATVIPLRPCAGTNEHRRLFERAVQYACDFRDRVADRAPRPVMSANERLGPERWHVRLLAGRGAG
jgi:hypothetical protein